jgi:hypothetical protein
MRLGEKKNLACLASMAMAGKRKESLMKTFKKITMALILSAIVTLQSGCVVGLTSEKRDYKKVLKGLACIVGGLATEIHGMAGFGIYLDEENPGRSDSLNPIPLDEEVAAELGTSVSSLEAYNYELSRVLVTDDIIRGHLQRVLERELDEEGLTLAAKDLGFRDGDHLVEVIKGESVDRDSLTHFASSQGLSDETAKIYLQLRYDIVVD